jgi:type I restriction enzyme M protein
MPVTPRKNRTRARISRPPRRGLPAREGDRDAGRRAALSLSRAELERHLWAAADILRGSIDSTEYKHYILGLLFLKRISDRFEEGAGRDPSAVFVPEAARFGVIERVTEGVGEALNRAGAAIEESNPALALTGVLTGIDFNDARRLGDAPQRDSVLRRLVEHFAKLCLRNDHLSEPDMLGRAYEYLIERFADDAGKKGGEFYTPPRVAELLAELLAPEEGMRVCDPTCGTGGMLIECARYVERRGGSRSKVALFGQEKNLATWSIGRMNMLLHGLPSARIERGDTIRAPKLLEGGRLMRFDRVIANPPFSLDAWGREAAEGDALGRFSYGLPPRSRGDFAFVEHMLATLEEAGRLAVVVPHGILFRGGSEGEIRRRMAEADLFEAVIGLPSNLFYGTAIPAAALVMSRQKAPERRGSVLFVDASRGYGEGKTSRFLRAEDVARIAKVARSWSSEPGFSRAAGREEIERNGFNLSLVRYLAPEDGDREADVEGALAKLDELSEIQRRAEAEMRARLAELGYGRREGDDEPE